MTSDRDRDETKLVIDILMREYETLRAEILARIRARFELLGFIAAVSAFLGSQAVSRGWRVAFVVAAVVLALGLWVWFARNIRACAIRVREIEEKVNEVMAGPLLQWESTRPQRTWVDRFIR